MSRFDYEQSKLVSRADVSFHALLMAAMRQADTHNAALLRAAFPETWSEMQARYDAPGGRLASDPA